MGHFFDELVPVVFELTKFLALVETYPATLAGFYVIITQPDNLGINVSVRLQQLQEFFSSMVCVLFPCAANKCSDFHSANIQQIELKVKTSYISDSRHYVA